MKRVLDEENVLVMKILLGMKTFLFSESKSIIKIENGPWMNILQL